MQSKAPKALRRPATVASPSIIPKLWDICVENIWSAPRIPISRQLDWEPDRRSRFRLQLIFSPEGTPLTPGSQKAGTVPVLLEELFDFTRHGVIIAVLLDPVPGFVGFVN